MVHDVEKLVKNLPCLLKFKYKRTQVGIELPPLDQALYLPELYLQAYNECPEEDFEQLSKWHPKNISTVAPLTSPDSPLTVICFMLCRFFQRSSHPFEALKSTKPRC